MLNLCERLVEFVASGFTRKLIIKWMEYRIHNSFKNTDNDTKKLWKAKSVYRMIQRQKQTIHYLCLQLCFVDSLQCQLSFTSVCVCETAKFWLKIKHTDELWNSIKCVDWMWIPVFDVLNTQINYFTDGHLANKYVWQFCVRFVGVGVCATKTQFAICMNQFICALQASWCKNQKKIFITIIYH